ncbi:hypothetical protein SAMN06296241_1443 [Salinimicrobium sediminis]|uniref:Sulfotransferase family protein n=1 Tax=Salinimicrobium sediminis TaxID=1343891 RepID=A0A285X3I2_9FLAO|nr:hypothetical protein [Salinimicrobium sediminis]SOC79903.1 hypothetical protein SAMN06296241_1443 [Salinimicrobium sediminis]
MKEKLHQEQLDHQNEFRITGISRSGNHAVINWILGHIQDKEFCFLNCTEPKFNPYETCRPLGSEEDSWYTNIPDFNIEEERKGNFIWKDYLLYSHEDSFLGPLEHREFKKNRERWIGKAKNRKDILIIRDPFNLFASRRKAGFLLGHEPEAGPKPMSVHSIRRIYKQHAKEVLGKSNFLKDKVVINFNRWVKNPVYREAIALELGLEHTDEGMQEVSRVAGGSSFDGTSISAAELHRKLEERWKIYAPDPAFQGIFDAELIALSKEIFGETEALKAILEYSKKEEEFSYPV